MTHPRSILTTTRLPVSTPGGGFDRAISLNSRTLGVDISPVVDLTEFDMSLPVFRPHPHAGFSAVTYMFEDSPGTFHNRWSKGSSALIPPGSLHWTQAGAGMIHEEVPTEPGTNCHGLQMFVKLAADDELSPPEAFHLDPDEIVELAPAPGARIRLLAGTLGEHDAGIAIRNTLTFAEIHLEPGTRVTLPATADDNAFVFVQRGTLAVDGHDIPRGHAAAFAHDGDTVVVTSGTQPTSFLYGAGAPLAEPMRVRGSFIMSDLARLDDAAHTYQRGEMGRLDASF
jgi:redox-sensitive bicupin YhaK (pirin superfamily)